MNSKNLYFNLEQQQSKYWSENSVKTGQSPNKILLERSLNDMFLKEVMILFHAKREKKAEKEDQTQAGQTSRSATEVQSLPPKKSQVPPQKKTVAVEPVITISLPDVGCLSIRQFAGTRCNHGRRKVNNWTIGFPVPSSAVCYGSTEQGSFIHHIGEGSHGLRVCSH